MRRSVLVILLGFLLCAPLALPQQVWWENSGLEHEYDLSPFKILVFLGDDFDYHELFVIKGFWEKWKAQVVIAGSDETLTGHLWSQTPEGWKKTEFRKIKRDIPLSRVNLKDYQAVFLPGGNSPQNLMDKKATAVASLVREANKKGLLLAAICHGPLVLAKSDVIRGRRVTGHREIKKDLVDAGGSFESEICVEDQNLITGNWPFFESFAIKVAEKLLFPGGGGKSREFPLLSQDEFRSPVKVFLYNFKPFSYHWTNKFKKEDRIISHNPSVEVEIKDLQDRRFDLNLMLLDAQKRLVLQKSRLILREERDKNSYVIIKFWLDAEIPFPQKAVVDIQLPRGRVRKDIDLEFVRIYGKSMNFDGSPRKDFVDVRDNGFESVYVVPCDDDGRYEMILPKRTYNAILTVNEQYDREVLENWVWNFTAEQDTELNFQVGGLEIYNLHAWPNNGGGPTMFVTFRPMSVHLGNLIDKNKDGSVDENESKEGRVSIPRDEFRMNPHSGIAPRLDENEVKVFLDGEELKVLSVAPYPEYVYSEGGNDFYQTGYVVQALRGKSRVGPGYHTVRVVIEDTLDYEGKMLTVKGEAFYFWRQEGNIYSVRKYRY